jgi:hypothetical protein
MAWSGAYLGFCQGGCTFLTDLPPPPPDLDLDPDPHQNNADPQPWAQLGGCTWPGGGGCTGGGGGMHVHPVHPPWVRPWAWYWAYLRWVSAQQCSGSVTFSYRIYD